MKIKLLSCSIIILALLSGSENEFKGNEGPGPGPADASVIFVAYSLDDFKLSAPYDKPSNPYSRNEPFIGRICLDGKTEKILFGTWKVNKLLGFANSYNDASEYPGGQKIIGCEIIMQKDFFSSLGLENYKTYQYEIDSPEYAASTITYDSDSFYRLSKIDFPHTTIGINDVAKVIEINDVPMCFIVVSNTRIVENKIVNTNKVILQLEAACFELAKVSG